LDPLRASDPETVGRYRIVGRLGAGGMGVVYLADGPRGQVALKLAAADLGDDPSFRVRFRREVQASFRVSSVHPAKLLDFDVDADRPRRITSARWRAAARC
jgi:serine/threonine protein kinase